LYRTRHKIENLFAKLKDWRRVANLLRPVVNPSGCCVCAAT
jgi:hypothetical protein